MTQDVHVEETLRACGYPSWSFAKVRHQIESKGTKKRKKRWRSWKNGPCDPLCRKGFGSDSESYEETQCSLEDFEENITECIYRVPCANCDKTYVGETGQKLSVRLQEHRTEVESKSEGVFTRSHTTSLTEYNKSPLTDHMIQENHTIHW